MTDCIAPRVSVIIPTHNRADLLPRAVSSVLAQTFADYEILIVDDGSSDHTRCVLTGYRNSKIRIFKHVASKNGSAARNTGLSHARGEYIAFLDDDDEWLPTKLANQVAMLDSAPPEVGMLYGWMDYLDSEGRIAYQAHKTIRGNVFEQLLGRGGIGACSTLVARASVVRQVGGFDECLASGQDRDFSRRVSEICEIDYLPEVVTIARLGHDRVSNNTHENLLKREFAAKRHLEKFSDALYKRPKTLAALFRQLAFTEMMLRKRRAALSTFIQGIKTDPPSINTLLDTFSLLKALIWYATPLAHLRNRARAIRNKLR